MKRNAWFRAFAILAAAIGLSAQTNSTTYAEGQVWEYKTRPQDAGSLLKIQRVTELNNQQVYHLSVIGVHFRTPGILAVLPHMPVSKATLDASVTKRSSSTAAFPTTAVDDGIEEWQRARGGVFTIPLSEIVDIADDQTSKISSQH
jgi:hypothetical protein